MRKYLAGAVMIAASFAGGFVASTSVLPAQAQGGAAPSIRNIVVDGTTLTPDNQERVYIDSMGTLSSFPVIIDGETGHGIGFFVHASEK